MGGLTGAGVVGNGGLTSGAGGLFTAQAGNSLGIAAQGFGSGEGVQGFGGATGVGGLFWGGTSGTGAAAIVLGVSGSPPPAVAGGMYFDGTHFYLCETVGAGWKTVTHS